MDQRSTFRVQTHILKPKIYKNLAAVREHDFKHQFWKWRWIQDVWSFYSSIATSEQAGESGVQIMSGYLLSDEEPQGRLYEDFVFSHRKMSREEKDRLNFGKYKFGYHVTTIVATVRKYYTWHMKRFLDNGGILQQRKVHSLEEFVGQCDVVVNCTGLGSRELVGDSAVHPVRGQVVRDVIVLGGCLQPNNYSLINSKEDTVDILKRCYELLPSLKGSQIEDVWTGLRPLRTPLRVEKEIVEFQSGHLKVVHNYGHGASGITLSWGTSLEAADLVRDMCRTTAKL
ncbi:hypothetical protein FSP39_000025 [Pinctada imbricata]|uniref:FAD dependent oxidoreductase domain-containing protein n=1 Tax=Pinctada imbricata TaxID=66713 RepID=A0AA89BL77_PINIB|nr:hypothetical protein FSP39_000025 [Pinctada imbricata]